MTLHRQPRSGTESLTDKALLPRLCLVIDELGVTHSRTLESQIPHPTHFTLIVPSHPSYPNAPQCSKTPHHRMQTNSNNIKPRGIQSICKSLKYQELIQPKAHSPARRRTTTTKQHSQKLLLTLHHTSLQVKATNNQHPIKETTSITHSKQREVKLQGKQTKCITGSKRTKGIEGGNEMLRGRHDTKTNANTPT